MVEILKPLTIYLDLVNGLSDTEQSSKRYLSDMVNMYHDKSKTQEILKNENPLIYEFYEMEIPQTSGDIAFGTSIVYPGKVGNEYFMTKGHFHSIIDTAEVYYCLKGHGYLLMETLNGEWNIQEMTPGKAIYVPKKWAHRSINISSSEELVTFFAFRADAGHDYKTIETKGCKKIIIEKDGKPAIIDNPNWD